MRSLNKVQLIGNLTRDPELRYTGSSTAVASFSIATNKSWKNQDGETQESVEYHNIVAWGKLGEICKDLLSKGAKVYVEGELTTRSWEDDSGTKRYRTEVKIQEMLLLDSKNSGGNPSNNSGSNNQSSDDNSSSSNDDASANKGDDNSEGVDSVDDLPF